MRNATQNVYFLERGEGLSEMADTGVSLHCHTLHSKELIDFVPYYMNRIPIASYFWRREMSRLEKLNAVPDFKTGHWTPPLSGEQVFEAERKNLAAFGLDGIVSITDHDSIDANLDLRKDIDAAFAPVSLEWTVPFENAFFHLGIHNLPIERAVAISRQLLDYTYAKGVPDNQRLHQLFSMLNELPGVLVVFNHPIWDIEMIGQQAHEIALKRFVAEHAKWLHAVEINGFRSWEENQAAIDLAEDIELPLISGGDRHCCQSNTMVNITDAWSFDEFVSEIRTDRFSRIAVMPEYHTTLPSRQLRSIMQIMGNYNDFPDGRQLWSDRVFLDFNDGRGQRTLTEHWDGRRPKWTYLVFLVLSVLAHPVLEPVIAMTVGDNDIGRDESKNDGGFAMGGSTLAIER